MCDWLEHMGLNLPGTIVIWLNMNLCKHAKYSERQNSTAVGHICSIFSSFTIHNYCGKINNGMLEFEIP